MDYNLTTRGLWVRYGGQSVTPEELEFAAKHYSVAMLQPWEEEAARRLKELNPELTILCYKCLSSVRSYEPGPVYSSGLSFVEAEGLLSQGIDLFAHRLDGQRIEWNGYPGHWQMKVWESQYRDRWVANVINEVDQSPFDGVMADNDIQGDYYGLDLPIQEARNMAVIHQGLEELVHQAGRELNARGKLLVPNIAESRVNPGKWERHSAYGGGFEEVFLGWGEAEYLDKGAAIGQMNEMAGQLPEVEVGGNNRQRLTLLRASTDGANEHPNFMAGLAGMWLYGGGRWSALSAGAHDEHNDTPWIPELAWDLGRPLEDPAEHYGVLARRFSNGWVALNLTDQESGTVPVPFGMVDRFGRELRDVILPAHQGIVLIAAPWGKRQADSDYII
ncbi:MAG: putative glycoside hydrolase [Rothia sp. (in: high G+C Gram-positive bacteria)]|nr:putative glycoside hydrolase [Rothia sp. (in: high G+C Gram-positive bacteria)]